MGMASPRSNLVETSSKTLNLEFIYGEFEPETLRQGVEITSYKRNLIINFNNSKKNWRTMDKIVSVN